MPKKKSVRKKPVSIQSSRLKNIEKQEFGLKQEYQKAWDYIRKSKKYFLIIATIFLIMALIGFFVPAPESISGEIMKILQELITKTEGMNSFELISFILINNIQTTFLGMIFGIVLGIFPIITTLINGYLLGFVSAMSVNLEGGLSLLKLLPHGIFEIPAAIIGLGLGLKLGTFPFKKNSKRKRDVFLKNLVMFLLLLIFNIFAIIYIIIFRKDLLIKLKIYLENSIRVFLLIILPLLLIAGIIEGFLIFLIN